MATYLYKGMKGIYNGINVIPGNVYEMNNPNPKLFEQIGKLEKETVKETIVERPAVTKDSIYSIMEKINGIGPKTSVEIEEEYDNLEELKKDIENGSFSVGGMSEKKINLIKRELKIGE